MLDNVDWSLAPDLRRLIVPIVRGILDAAHLQEDYEILRRRYAFDSSSVYTLQEVGTFFGVSRERIRQREERSLTRVRQVLFDIGGRASALVPQDIVQETLDLQQMFRSADSVFNEIEVADLLQARYKSDIDKDNNAMALLMAVLGFKQLGQHFTNAGVELITSWATADSLDCKMLHHAVQAVRSPLYSKVVPMNLFDLVVEVNRKRQKRIDKSYIRWALKIRPDIEVVGQDAYQVKFVRLPSLADKAYRVLWEAREPKHLRFIWGEISHILARTGSPQKIPLRSVQQQLVQDSRFKPIGRGGYWKLVEWTHINENTIVDLILAFFHVKKSPACSSEIYEYVHSKRDDATRQSVITYLASRKDLFVKSRDGGYALAAWENQGIATDDDPSLSKVLLATKDAFSDRSEMPLRELIHELSKRTQFADSTLYREVRNLSIVEVIANTDDSRAKTVRYTGNAKLPSSVKKTHHKPSIKPGMNLRIAVQTEIVDFLRKQPAQKSSVQVVSDHVVSKLKCAKPTFYRYLSEMPDVAKVDEAGTLFCYLPSTSGDNSLFPQVDQIEDAQLRDNIRRCVELLKVETVDMALAQLGKIFEVTLKEFLQAAQARGKYVIGKKDLERLVDMIDCIKRNGIVTNKHHLTFLREERNERVHGVIPDIKERETLMQVSLSLAGLFIYYTEFFFRQRKLL